MNSEEPKISVVLSVLNESAKIGKTLDSVKWADEIIVVDNGSTDATVGIVRKYTGKILSRQNNPMLNINKNYGITKATGDWILYLDGDEEIPPELKEEIRFKIKQSGNTDGYWIPRKNIIFGKWIMHGLWWPDRQLRLFRRGKGKYPCRHVHEYIEVPGKTETLDNAFIHHNYESVSQYLNKMDRIYTENEVANLQATGYRISWYDAVRFPVSDFLKVYFAQKAYLDGLHGLALSFLQAFYSFIVFAKLWENDGFSEKEVQMPAVSNEFRKAGREIRYWLLTAGIHEARNFTDKLLLKIKRRM
jgi:glycosyltransferase involved in cell wall biosynthesis